MFKKLLSIIALAGFSLAVMAQDVKVSGIVTDINGNALPSVLIVEKGTTNAAKSAMDGSYSLTIPAKRIPATVMVRSVGFGTSEFNIDGSSSTVTFSPSLGSSARSLNEVVVSASKKSEKLLNAPASVSIISETKIQQNTALAVVDNVRKTAAVDVMPTGLVSNNVVVRGFNNIFSGASMFMVDNRLASVPSLRVNAFQLVPTSNTDVRSMEVVRGPASALYGPFASNGVIAVYTKSPLDMENRMEVTLGLTSGLRAGDDDITFTNGDGRVLTYKADNSIERLGILNPEIRIAGKLSKTLGIKVSGSYLSATDFSFYDYREPNDRSVRFGNQAGGNLWASDGSSETQFNRDFRIKKIAGDARVDWRPAVNTELSFSTGYANNTNVELTGLGGAQAVGWTSNYFQTQFKKDRFYAQYFINMTNSGNTYLIPQNPTQTTFTYLKENSNLQSLQLQHSSKALQNKLHLVYGYDMYMTRPSGNVYGRFDGNANINQYGGYLQGEYKFNKQWSTTLAARMDYQDAINEWMFSPRGAVVYKPKENHTFRVTYNRAFASPTSLNFFLDLNNRAIVPGQVYGRGFGNSTGIMYNLGTDGLPNVTLGNGTNVDYSAYTASNAFVTAGVRQAIAAMVVASMPGAPLSSGVATANALLNGLSPSIIMKDIVTGQAVDIKTVTNRESVKSTVTQTAEFGYKGLVTDKLSLGVDFYYTRINDFVSPLTTATYNVIYDQSYFANPAVQAQMMANIAAISPSVRPLVLSVLTGKTNPTPTEIVTGYATRLVEASVAGGGTVAPDNTGTNRDVIQTYLNLGTVDVAGADLSFNYVASNVLTIEGAFSFVNKDRIPLAGAADGYVSLNAPKYKSALSMEYKLPIDKNNVTARLGWRWMDKFDANSGVYVGRVNAMNMLDLGLSWRPSHSQNTVLSLNVNNVLDHRHQFFPMTSPMGRVALFKILHTFGVK